MTLRQSENKNLVDSVAVTVWCELCSFLTPFGLIFHPSHISQPIQNRHQDCRVGGKTPNPRFPGGEILHLGAWVSNQSRPRLLLCGMLQCFLNGKSWTRALVILNTKPFTTHTSKNTMEGFRIIRDDQYEHQRWVASVGGQWDHFEGKLSDLIHSTAADLDMMANELLLSPYFYSILPVSSS
ncbi:hypothetical protein PROFUN_09333 [Planoprotostelium fungivorum]|uniref:Uncharacterized protein n=1 Tax=Planoprotostelium fungivorum TaxID=1890364 RepID=A0A2P6NHE7_9EUKA|nr:hypothetical protein PROFUN_09333 [Planoprotostelium fungivorum]